jgi:hypothetical protein
MPSTEQWIHWAENGARTAFPHAWSHDHYLWLSCASGTLRTLRDRPAETSGASWSRVDELGQADHYFFMRSVIACALGLGYLGPPAYASSPTMTEFTRLIEMGSGTGADDVLRRSFIDGHDGDPNARFAVALHGLRVLPRSLVGGVAALCFALVIPLWELLKGIAWATGAPGLVPGEDTLDRLTRWDWAGQAGSSTPGFASMSWAYSGIADALSEDAPFAQQFRYSDPRRVVGLSMSDFDAALANLPAGAAPSAEAWGMSWGT